MKLWTTDRPSESPEYRRLWDAVQAERELLQLRRDLAAWQRRLQVWTALLILAAVAFAYVARALGRL